MHAALFGKTECVEAVIRHYANKREKASTVEMDTKLKESADEGTKELVLESYAPPKDGDKRDVRIKPGDVLVLAPETNQEEKETVADNGPPIKIKGKLRHEQYALVEPPLY